LIVWRLGLLHPYLPDGSRLARGVISGGAARLAAFVFLKSIIGVGVKFYLRIRLYYVGDERRYAMLPAVSWPTSQVREVGHPVCFDSAFETGCGYTAGEMRATRLRSHVDCFSEIRRGGL